MFYFLFSNFYKQTYIKKEKKGIESKQNKTKSVNICFPKQSGLYENNEEVSNGIGKDYSSNNNVRLRNKATNDDNTT